MSLKLLASVVFALGVASSPALACKGSQSLLSDDFKGEMDPAWEVVFGEFNVSDGKLQVKTDVGKVGLMEYQGDFFPGADVCVDIVAPSTKDAPSIFAGIAFSTPKGNYYVGIRPDGSAGVLRYFKGWLKPVPVRKFDAVKTAVGATNSLRVVWKAGDTSVQTFVNDRPFITFKTLEANDNRKIGIYAETEGNTLTYSNFKVTSPPK
jgi:hypothetical protein